MKAILTLNNPLWNTPERRKILDTAVQESAIELESEIKQTILDSTPRGRLYRRGAITKRASKNNSFLRKVAGNSKRVIAGSKFHRASAKGQPFATDTGGLLNSIRAKKTAELKAKVATNKNYAPRLDDKNKLDRPFFESTAEKFKAKFKQNLEDALKNS